MKFVSTIGKTSLILLCVFALILDMFFIYYRFIDPTRTVGITNIDNQLAVDIPEEEVNELEERLLFTVNLYDNQNQNGVVLAEMQMNYFTGYDLSQNQYRSSGYQLAVNFGGSGISLKDILGIDTGFCANYDIMLNSTEYDTTDGVSWNGRVGDSSIMTGLERNKEYIIKIDNQPYSICLNGTYTKSEPLWGFLWNVTNTYEYTFFDLYKSLLKATQVNSEGEGTCYIQPDLSEFFTVKKYNTETGEFEPQDYTDIVKKYASVKITYSKNGAQNSEQSLFGIIANNSSFDVEEKEIITDYWTATLTYNLTEKDLSYRYSELYNGYFVSLAQDKIIQYNKMPGQKVILTIDLDNAKNNIVGLDYNAFQHYEIDTLILKSSSERTINLLDYCLDDTGLNYLKYSSNITVVKSELSTTDTYEEVII